jgi:hypothetical protein
VGREFLRLTNIPLPLAPLPLPPRAGAKIRTSEAEVLPFVWLQGPDASDQRELVWLKLGPKIKDNTRSLVAVLSKAEGTRAGFGGYLKEGADDFEAFSRGVRFGKTGWDAVVDTQFVAGRVWRFTGVVPGTVRRRRARRPRPSSAPTTPRRWRRRRRRGARERETPGAIGYWQATPPHMSRNAHVDIRRKDISFSLRARRHCENT